MNQKALKVINILLLIIFPIIVLSVIGMLLGYFYSILYYVHISAGGCFVLLIITHIILNRKWIKKTYGRND